MPVDTQAFEEAPTTSVSASGTGAKRLPSWLTFLVREPFFQFLVLGFLIWGAVDYHNAENDRYTVAIGRTERARIAESYLQQYRREPTPEQLGALLDRYVRDEIYVREAKALHLDTNDEIIRRRLVQKYEFLQTDLSVPEAPTPEVLVRWFEENKARYLVPEQVSFAHIYFSTDKVGEDAARRRAAQVLGGLRQTTINRAPGLGDAYPGPSDVVAITQDDAKRQFGESEILAALSHAPLRQWLGPFRSGYGLHLVYLTERLPSRQPVLDEVRDRATADCTEYQRDLLRKRALEKLRSKYRVRYMDEGQ